MSETRTYKIRNSEKCFRFKPDAFINHAPMNRGIYELVTFDENQQAKILYVGAAFDKTIKECLEEHATGDRQPTAESLLVKYPNLYFDYLTEMNGARSVEDAADVYWWLVQKHKPVFNDVAGIRPSERPGDVNVVELE